MPLDFPTGQSFILICDLVVTIQDLAKPKRAAWTGIAKHIDFVLHFCNHLTKTMGCLTEEVLTCVCDKFISSHGRAFLLEGGLSSLVVKVLASECHKGIIH